MSNGVNRRVARSGAVAAHSTGAAPEAQTGGGIFTALILILLTLVVYLFSLTLPDDTRRRAIHASLAKAFLFDIRHAEHAPAAEGPRHLLSPARQRLRELKAALMAGAGTVTREGDALVVSLPAERLFAPGGTEVTDPRGALAPVARLLAAAGTDARVEASAEPDAAAATARTRSLSRAVAVTRALLATPGAAGLDAGRLSAVGLGADAGSLDDPEAPDAGQVRIVVTDAEGVL
jgi:hypothetical protein